MTTTRTPYTSYTVSAYDQEDGSTMLRVWRNDGVRIVDGAGRRQHQREYDESSRTEVMEMSVSEAAGLANSLVSLIGCLATDATPTNKG